MWNQQTNIVCLLHANNIFVIKSLQEINWNLNYLNACYYDIEYTSMYCDCMKLIYSIQWQ